MSVSVTEDQLLRSAQRGDEQAFRRLLEPYRGELHAHCYRMLGSLHDAEDALQDALLRAWRGLARAQGISSLRAWLYKIATNASLDVIGKRPKRTLPVDYGPSTDPADGPGQPLVESVWIDPYPDETLAVEDGYAAPEARFERRESVELAFIAALQHLPANQRAVLIMREVLGFSAAESAATLDTSVPSINSALQRARKTVDEKLPEQSQQATLRTIGDERLQGIVEDYMEALDGGDVPRVVSMLADDAAWSMPPLASWFRGDDIPEFLARYPLSGEWRWKRLATRANGQPAVAAYIYDDDAGAYLPFALDVLTFEGDRIKEVTAFITRTIELPDRDDFARWPDKAQDPARVVSVFERFGLPASLS
jgi:RNA polymerase sigma-70 factor, ECF subfamily